MEDWYWYEVTGECTVRLLRIFGTSPEVIVPERIAGRTVTELSAYCFAQEDKAVSFAVCSERLSGEEAGREFERLLGNQGIRKLCGGYLRKVTLPQSIAAIGDFCFYQCSHLEEITLGNGLNGIGGDAFMNCRELHKIVIRGGIVEPSGLKQILAQRPAETEVSFVTDKGTEGVLLFPEYSETYDEVGPAHIFALTIEGEGFRARQCFRGGVVDLAQYDGIFSQARTVESERTLCRMALMRLYYPAGLSGEGRRTYEEYLRAHAGYAGKALVRDRESGLLFFAGEQGYLGEQEVADCILYAAAENWTEGAGMLLQYQKKWFARDGKDEYSFEEF